MTEPGTVRDAVVGAHREHWARLLALLTRQFGGLDLAEDSLQDAFAAALTTWPRDGVPHSPAGWLLTTARRRGVDRLRRDQTLARKLPLLAVPDQAEPEEESMSTIPDLRLRLLFTCCHPALGLDARVALTLRCVGGLTTAQIASAFLVSEPTMAARITRARKKIAAARIPYAEPSDAELPDRMSGVLAVLYLVFNEGYKATAGDEPIRRELCEEAIRLARVLVALAPDEPEAVGLLALMLLQHARRDARFDPAGRLVLLPDQDRARWDPLAIREGLDLLDHTATVVEAGPYRLQAAIAAEHVRAASTADTDWNTISAFYQLLEELTGSPVVRLNRAVAVAEVDGPLAGLSIVDSLGDRLEGYHLLHSTRADLLRRLGRRQEAVAAYRRALLLAGSSADQELLRRRVIELSR